MNRGRVIVIGGDAAGMSAASKIRRTQPDREILVFEKSDHTSYSACGMPYLIGGLIENKSSLVARSPETFRDKYDIDVRIAQEVTEIDTVSQRVRINARGKNHSLSEPYDQLLIATGGLPFCPDVPGSDARGIFGLSSLDSGLAIKNFIEREKPQKAVIIGAGYIGLEMAEALIRIDLDVSLVEASPEVMNTLDPDMGSLVSEALHNIGVSLYLEEEFKEFEVTDNRVRGVVTDRRVLDADIVVLGMGVRPNSRLATEAGIELGVKNAIKVDGRMQTSTPNIWAAGDCAATIHRVTGLPVHIALGTIANKQGLVAGTNISGGHAWFPGVVGTAVTKVCDLEIGRTGLQEKELDSLGTSYVSEKIESKTRAGYFPGAGKMTVKMIAEKDHGKVLGTQIVGMEGAAKRIDIIATALTAGMSVQEIIDLDLSYAPPFSPVWDPVQTAARQLVKKI